MNPRLQILIADWLHDDLDEHGCAELAELLLSDSAHQNYFRHMAGMHRQLHALTIPVATRAALVTRVMNTLAPLNSASSVSRGHRSETVRGVFRRLAERKQRTRRRWLRILLASGVAALVVIGLVIMRMPEPARVLTVQGVVTELAPAGQAGGKTLHPSDVIAVDHELASANGASATIGYSDDTHVAIHSSTRIHLARPDHGRQLFLHDGGIEVNAAPQPHDAPMSVHTRWAVATVVGTIFCVQTSARATCLCVREGHVRFALPGQANGALLIGPGERALATAEGSLTRLPPPPLAHVAADAENGILAPPWITGAITKPPPGNNSHYCFQAVAADWTEETRQLVVGDWTTGLCDFDPDLVLSFDYWVTPGLPWAGLWMGNLRDRTTQDYALKDSGHWVHQSVRLGEFQRGYRNGRVSERGERIAMISFQIPARDNAHLFIDNVRLSLPDPAAAAKPE